MTVSVSPPEGSSLPCHDLKCWPEFYEALIRRDKMFEVRKADRPFAVGDWLKLREWNPETGEYTGRFVMRYISFILTPEQHPGVAEGHVVLGLR